MIWRTILYDFPTALLLVLLLIPIIACFIFLYQDRKSKLHAFAVPRILEVILEKRSSTLFWTKVFLYCLAWICGVIALAQPKGNERYVTKSPQIKAAIPFYQDLKNKMRKKTHEVIFLLDASASMNISDTYGKTRLDAAKEIADDLISRLQGENIALFAFTSNAMQIVPSTLDYLFTRLMLRQIQINEGETEGTNIKLALGFLQRLYDERPISATKTLILFSDGGDTRLTGLNSAETKQEIQEIISPITDAEEKNLRVFVVGIGSLEGSEVPGVFYQGHPVRSALEEPLLRKLSIAGRGDLFLTNNMTALQISQKLALNIARDDSFVDVTGMETRSQKGETHVYDLYFQLPLGIGIAALAICLVLPDTRKKLLLILVLFHSTLNAQEEMQLAHAYFESENYPQAKRTYEWLLEENMPEWQQDILKYNIGTTLLAQGEWEEAIPYFQLVVDTSLPLLKQRATANLAVGRLMQLQTELHALSANSPVSIQLFLLFRQALLEMENAHQAWCELGALEGTKPCPFIGTDYTNAQQYLQAVVQSLIRSRPMKTRIMDAIAHLYGKQDASKDPTADQSPKKILKDLIAKAEFLLLLHQLQPQSSEDIQDWKEVYQQLSPLQQQTVEKADTFLPSVINQQNDAFSSSDSSLSRCQCHPWDEVIPLFYQGYQQAKLAATFARKKNKDLQENHRVKEWTKKAVVFWKEALNKMNNASSPSEQPKTEPEPQQNEPYNQDTQNHQEATQLHNLLRTLQNMEQDDRSKPAFKTATGTGGESKPW